MNGQIDLRQFVGTIVIDEITRGSGGPRKVSPFSRQWDISRQTIQDVRDGKPTVRADTLRALEGALRLPTRLFDYIIAGDVERIRKISTREEGGVFRADLKEWIIEGMASLELPRDRRAEDRRQA